RSGKDISESGLRVRDVRRTQREHRRDCNEEDGDDRGGGAAASQGVPRQSSGTIATTTEENMTEPKMSEETLNGLHPEKLKGILESLKQPEVLAGVSGPWKARVVWQGGFHAKAYMRTHAVEMDEPAGLDACDLAASAHEQHISAMSACMAVRFVPNAPQRGTQVPDTDTTLEGNFDNILKSA